MVSLSSKINKIKAAIKRGRNFFLAGHLNPDGDTLGSALCLASVLRRLGKKAFVFSSDPVPENLKFLLAAGPIKVGALPPSPDFDTAILLECSTPKRAGDIASVLHSAAAIINIDHHRTFEPYGDINLVDPTSSSTAELVFELVRKMKVRLSPEEATCLYVGIVTDTGRFHYPATTAKSLKTAAALLEAGADAPKVNDIIYATKALPALKLLGSALGSLEIIHGGKTAVSVITLADMARAKAVTQHTEDIVNYGLMVPGIKASVLFRQEKERIAVNFRSKGALDVSLTAKRFGGGGHKNAAGCKIKLPLNAVRRNVLGALSRAYLRS